MRKTAAKTSFFNQKTFLYNFKTAHAKAPQNTQNNVLIINQLLGITWLSQWRNGMSLSRHIAEFIGRITIFFESSHLIIKRPIANLDALRGANTNPGNFVLHEITDSCERVFQTLGIGLNGSGYPFEKNCHPFERLLLSVWKRNVIPSNGSGCPSEKVVIRSKNKGIRSNGSGYPFKTVVSRATIPNHVPFT